MKRLNMVLTAAAAAAALGSAQAQEAFAPSYYASEVAGEATAKADFPKLAKNARAVVAPAVVDLGGLDDYSLIAKRAVADKPNVRVIGVPRASDATKTAEATGDLLKWQTLADGRKVAAVQFTSGNAFAVRVGLLVQSLPATAVVSVYIPGDAVSAMDVTGARIQEVIQRNVDAGDNSNAARTFWLPTLDGDSAVVQIELPASASTADVQVAVPHVAHIFESLPQLAYEDVLKDDSDKPATNPNDPRENMPANTGVGTSGNCNYDASCAPEIGTVRKSVARMSWMAGTRVVTDPTTGASQEVPVVATCTGTLMADQGRTGTPYLLTAAHCIDNQTDASSLETDWRFHTQSCTDGALSNLHTRLAGTEAGARLLYSESNYDTTLLQLDHKPHGEVLYTGWWSSQELHQSVYGISHPSGDLQKVSYGRISGYMVCLGFDTQGMTSCRPGLRDHSDFFNVEYSYGTTEGGSSGSGIFARHQDGNYYLTGVLSAGSASCTQRDGNNIYGRFDRAYENGLKYFLGEKYSDYLGLRPIYRFFNTSSGSHFYTQKPEERDAVIRNYPAMLFEGEAYWAYPSANLLLAPVHRFYNSATGGHFYTISEEERAILQGGNNSYQYEGVAWYTRAAPTDGTAPVYRFYNTKTDTHFYTISHDEKRLVDAIYPEFKYDGIAYYAWPKTDQ